jgi:signal transduction histidine kinase
MAASIRRDLTVNFVKHDLYAPLRVIDDQAQQLQEYLNGRERRMEYVPANIKASVVLAKNLAGSLCDQQAFSPEPTYLEGDIIARLRDGLGRFAWVENRMRINYEGLREIPRLNLDRNLIERVICNLLINAIKYGYEETDIEVIGEKRPETDNYAVRVENYGIGIKPEEELRIFEGTFRSPAAKERKLGLGLGLKIARAAMRRHGGDLRLETRSEPTVFALIFPRALALQQRNL